MQLTELLLTPMLPLAGVQVLVLDLSMLLLVLFSAVRTMRLRMDRAFSHATLTLAFTSLILLLLPLIRNLAAQVAQQAGLGYSLAYSAVFAAAALGAEILVLRLVGGRGAHSAFLGGLVSRVVGLASGLVKGCLLCLLLILAFPPNVRNDLNMTGARPHLAQPVSGAVLSVAWRPLLSTVAKLRVAISQQGIPSAVPGAGE